MSSYRKFYERFYNYFSIERDAYITSLHQTIGKLSNIVTSTPISFSIVVDNGHVQFEEFLNSYFDEYIKQHLHILDIYPILLKEYNKDGTKKDIYKIIKAMYEELHFEEDRNRCREIRAMYYEIIYNLLIKMDLYETISFLKMNYSKSLLISMKKYFYRKYIDDITNIEIFSRDCNEKNYNSDIQIKYRKKYYLAKLDYLDKLLAKKHRMNKIKLFKDIFSKGAYEKKKIKLT